MKENPNLETAGGSQRPFSQGAAPMHLRYLFPTILVVSLSYVILAGGPPAASVSPMPLLSHHPADLNLDTMVDFNDLLILAAEWLQSGDNLLADIYPADGDGLVNLSDFAEFAKYWRHTQMPVPEDMVLIPGGEFDMGDHFDIGDSMERPVHRVNVRSFYMDRYETTNRQYCEYLNSVKAQYLIEVRGGVVYAVGGSSPYLSTHEYNSYSRISWEGEVFTILPDKETHPLVEVSWYGAFAYCNWLSARDGFETCYDLSSWKCDFSKNGYRLPTEAEWEYAARGGLRYYMYPWGNEVDGSRANWWGSADPYEAGSRPWTAPVGCYQSNGYGLYDMTGNAMELCNDWWRSDYYSISPYSNPRGPETGLTRVIRGGAWGLPPYMCRVAFRDRGLPTAQFYCTGFRLVTDLRNQATLGKFFDNGSRK